MDSFFNFEGKLEQQWKKQLDEFVVAPTFATFNEKIPALQGFKEREGQTNMALDIAEAIKHNYNLIVEAGVGIGKSLAYLIPGLFLINYTKKPIVIATSSITLSEQLMGDAHQASRISKVFVTPVLGKGMNNYACLKRIAENETRYHFLKKTPKQKPSKLEEFLITIPEDFWTKLTQYQDRAKYPGEIKDTIWDLNNVHDCLYQNCPHNMKCDYYKMRMEISERGAVNVLIINQDLLISHLLKKQDNGLGFLKNYGLLIIDEAHNLEDKMRSALTKEFDERSGIRLLNKVKIKLSRQSSAYLNDIQCIEDSIRLLFQEVSNQIVSTIDRNRKMIDADRFPVNIPDSLNIIECCNRLHSLSIALTFRDSYRDYDDNENLEEDINEWQTMLSELSKNEKSPYLYWALYNRVSPEKVKICYAPKSINRKLNNLLFEPTTAPIILTSATLCQPKDSIEEKYNYIVKKLGFEGELAEPQTSPFPYNQNARLFIPTDMVEYNSDPALFLQQTTVKIIELASITDGRTMVLFTSKDDMNRVYQRLIEMDMPWEVIKQNAGSSQIEARRRFVKSKGILLGTGVFWEGFNVPGPDLSSLIIVRLPFPVPDPIIEYRCSKSKNHLMNVLVPEMLIKLRQGVGRLIRSENDTGILTILDPRISSLSTRNYKDITLQSLPIQIILETLEDVRKFALEKIPSINREEGTA